MGLRPLTGHADQGGSAPFGALRRDPHGVIDVPPGFRYRVIATAGRRLGNGASSPAQPDGMAAFQRRDGGTVLLRNHELAPGEGPPVEGRRPYDKHQPGGVTAVILDSDRRPVRELVMAAGHRSNCSGGATPWGTWLTGEETRIDRHGYVFEVDPREPEGRLARTPIRAMGFFSHEAIAVDPARGVVYLTEDDFRGEVDHGDPAGDTRSAFLYRYLPHDRRRRPGALGRGGKLQALAISERHTRNADFYRPSRRFKVHWRTVDPQEAHADALAKGCVRFNRLEGCDFGGGTLWFADTAGGEHRLGQVFRYHPGTHVLELIIEATRKNQMQNPDGLCVTPWGDLFFCEDGEGHDRLMGLTPHGRLYEFARNRMSTSELVGATFSPDGRTLFLSIQYPGLTVAIWGPFRRRDHAGARRLAVGDAGTLGPALSDDQLAAVDEAGLGVLEAAALDRLGVPLLD